MATLAALRVKLIADIGQFQQAMQDAERKASQIGKNMQQAGRSLTTRVTVPVIGMGAAALKASMDFNKGMANVASLGDEAAQHIEEWKSQVQDLAIEMGKSTSDMAEGLYQVVSAFGASSDSVEILGINAKAAAAGLSSVGDAVSLTSAVTKAYGDTSAQTVKRVADLALRTVQMGQTTFPELAASIGRVTPLAATLGVSMEDLFAVMATATGVTGGAAEVSTQMRGALQALMAPTDDMARLLSDLGYESGQAMIKQLGFAGALQTIVRHAEATGQPLQKFIGSVEGVTLALALSEGLSESYAQKLAGMQSAAGALDEAFMQQTQGVNQLGFALEQLKQMVMVVAQRLGDALAPAVMELVTIARPWLDRLMEWLGKFQQLDTRTQAVILGVVGFVAVLGPALVIIGTVVSAISSIIGAVSAVVGVIQGAGAAIIAALGPVGVAILAVVGIVALLYTAWTHNWGGLQEKTRTAVEWVKSKLADLVNRIRSIFSVDWGSIGRNIVSGIVGGITGMAGALVDRVKGLVQSAIDTAKSVLGIHSPSAVFAKFGEQSIEGYVKGMMSLSDRLNQAVAGTMVPQRMPMAAAGSVGVADVGTQMQPISITINNPAPEAAEDSIARAMRRLAYLGKR